MTNRWHGAIVALALLTITVATTADWRADVRAKMNPQRSLLDVLGSQSGGDVLVHWIGNHFVELVWNGSLDMYVDSERVTDLDQWFEDEGSLVLAFESHDGRGQLGASGKMGLRGWVYLDDLSALRVELAVQEELADGRPTITTVYRVDAFGDVADASTLMRCRCRTGGGWVAAGCDSDTIKCTNAMSCASPHSGHKCEWQLSSTSEFASAFETMIESE